MDPLISLGLIGSAGGLIRTIDWYLNNTKTPTAKTSVLKIIRNILLGFIGAMAGLDIANAPIEISRLTIVIAFASGISGELLLQKLGTQVEKVTK